MTTRFRILLLLVLSLAGNVVWGAMYSCVNAKGEKLRSDRELSGCVGEQWELNTDGSRKRLVPLHLSPEEEAAAEEKRRKDEAEATERKIRQRNEERLLKLYPNQAALEAARQNELAATRASITLIEGRIADLMAAHKPLLNEAEFYPNKPLPPILKSQLDANEALLAAQRQALQGRYDDLKRINDRVDAELQQLRVLWLRRSPAPK
ncbi:MAG: hypothetical protein K8R60_00495 [Burkholderiales bacterium]|nr:hypothetical protein [Burkholderiales bacterium]